MVATEAAAEGLNLQFCSMVVNYDLPWNPQRIEQRIGRCHRYGQKYDVVVVNFLNKNNAADQRIFELLSEKFKLFSGVFGASDEVLGVIESGVAFEKRIISIYQKCRTTEEIETEFEQLRTEMDSQITETMEDTRQKMLENFDADVHDRLRMNFTKSKEYLGRYEHMLWSVAKHELSPQATFDDDYMTFILKNSPGDLDVPTGDYYLSKVGLDGHRYRLGHPLAQHILGIAETRKLGGAEIVFDYTAWPQKAVSVEPLVGKSGVMSVQKLIISGADAQDHIILAAITDDGTPLDPKAALRLFDLPAKKSGDSNPEISEAVQQTIEAHRKAILKDMAEQQAAWFDEEMDKLDNWAEDKRAGLKADLKDFDDQIKELKRQVRQTGNLPDKLVLQKQARKLEQHRDEAWHDYDNAARKVDVQKGTLLDQVEERLEQHVSDEVLFTIRWHVK